MKKIKYKDNYAYCPLEDCKYFADKCRLAASDSVYESAACHGMGVEVKSNRACYVKLKTKATEERTGV